MFNQALLLTSLLSSATAFPSFAPGSGWNADLLDSAPVRSLLEKRQLNQQDALGISKAETNCGPKGPCLTFSESQRVSITGENVYRRPAPSDIRGPCPGLNAAANHGYLPRNGIASIQQTVSGLGAAYALEAKIAALLAAYAIAIDGNIVQGLWSIGGPLPKDPLLGGIIGTGQGISFSHNNYEGDASIGRNDAYINNGDAHSLNVAKFEEVYSLGGPEDRYTIDKFRERFGAVQQASIRSNPYYFTGLFSTVVVVPAAYNFVINLMSNHSETEKSGYLDGYNFKTFFAITGQPGSFKWLPGQERIPENWYRRPATQPYSGEDIAADVAIGYAAYPETLLIGGNTGKVNTFTGLSPAQLTNGVYNAQTLFEGDNFACFAFQLLQNGIPDFINPVLGNLAKATALINQYLSPITGDLSCPQWSRYEQGLFNKFPGYKYNPSGPATNYKA